MKCRKCSQEVLVDAKFCSNCGARQKTGLDKTAKLKFLALVLLLTPLLLFAADFIANSQAGTRPKLSFLEYKQKQGMQGSTPSHGKSLELPKELEALKQEIQGGKGTSKEWIFALITYYEKARAASPTNSNKLAFFMVSELSEYLKKFPKDKEALAAMAQLSFEQQIFDKAVIYYQRYLELEPSNLDIRARYASALAFQGKLETALMELEAVIKEDPNHFQGNAYASIAYSQQGDLDKALAYGKTAIKLAPNEEAKERFEKFLETMQQKAKDSEESDQLLEIHVPIVEYLKANPIAGPKFVAAESKGPELLALGFKDFPMDQMPPFAKEKFFAGIKAKVLELNLEQDLAIEFLDFESKKQLDSLQIAAAK